MKRAASVENMVRAAQNVRGKNKEKLKSAPPEKRARYLRGAFFFMVCAMRTEGLFLGSLSRNAQRREPFE